jgi:diguanylate cyclase (GGDEF)-like protein
LVVDAQTELPNRAGFFAHVETVTATLDETATCWLLLVDIDDLRAANDRLGHAAVDDYLRRLAAAFRAALPREVPLARVGGQEFAALLVDASAVGARDTAETLRSAGAELPDGLCTVRVGVVGWQPTTETLEEAMHRADLAVHSARCAGGNCVHVFGIDD